MRRKATLLCVMAVSVLTACGFAPFPRIAVPGTTITILIPPEFEPGFGRMIGRVGDPPPAGGVDPSTVAAYDPANHNAELEDLQRGELVFKLVPTPGPGPEYHLPVEFVTRVRAERTTPAGLFDRPTWAYGQVVAFVMIPQSVTAGSYEIELHRYWRDLDPVSQDYKRFVHRSTELGGTNWKGWGVENSTPDKGIPIEILDCELMPGNCPDKFSARTGYGALRGWVEFGTDRYYPAGGITAADLAGVTPWPFLQLSASGFGGPGEPCLGAWDLEIEYPIEKFLIKGVTHYGNHTSQVYVHADWDETPPDPECDTVVETDVLRVQVVAPECQANDLSIAFELRPDSFLCAGEGGRAEPSDFDVVESQGYDQDGQLIPPMTLEKSAAFM